MRTDGGSFAPLAVAAAVAAAPSSSRTSTDATNCTSAVAECACSVARFDCTCLAGLEASLVRSAPTGTCTVIFTVMDGWGQQGSPSFLFDVANPRLPVTGLTRAPAGSEPGWR